MALVLKTHFSDSEMVFHSMEHGNQNIEE